MENQSISQAGSTVTLVIHFYASEFPYTYDPPL